jgi:putative membrane protein
VLFTLALLILLLTQFKFGENLAIYFSEKGPGAQHPAVWMSLAGGTLLGVLMQKSRFCTIGAFRNFVLFRDTQLLNGVIALVVFAAITNSLLGQFHVGFEQQPIAHNQYIWNFFAMALCGLCFALGGGCPGKQLVNIGEGNNDAALFVLGMLLGAAAAHNFGLAASPTGVTAYTPHVLVLGFAACVYIGVTNKSKA